ncbi:uncharacterized protein A1O9_06674 [Exophiala aquamarina CBS 119918]|uniref:Uncharacterized protein n=1 Tax=Exophiala aquamarina CBS 119918 TaxID=1182545 RepID=A0A072PHH3_9EURO|nr:uncharacterized protein A1O9_06674 [Exophiala aquamarina CBS 119918]KEF58748.1 hypothetical protein A1O9_06674 [Exophiala aquamarina CBS 119918]
MTAYGMSKAAVSWAASRIRREEDRLVVIAMQPGWVGTAMGNKAAAFAGLSPSDVPVSIQDSVSGLMRFFDMADKETHSGKFWDQGGQAGAVVERYSRDGYSQWGVTEGARNGRLQEVQHRNETT